MGDVGNQEVPRRRTAGTMQDLETTINEEQAKLLYCDGSQSNGGGLNGRRHKGTFCGGRDVNAVQNGGYLCVPVELMGLYAESGYILS